MDVTPQIPSSDYAVIAQFIFLQKSVFVEAQSHPPNHLPSSSLCALLTVMLTSNVTLKIFFSFRNTIFGEKIVLYSFNRIDEFIEISIVFIQKDKVCLQILTRFNVFYGVSATFDQLVWVNCLIQNQIHTLYM